MTTTAGRILGAVRVHYDSDLSTGLVKIRASGLVGRGCLHTRGHDVTLADQRSKVVVLDSWES